jgi:hypothetical protein
VYWLCRDSRSSDFSKRNGNGVAFRKGLEAAAIAGMRILSDELPTVAQHAGNVLIHCLHAGEQPLPVIFPGPIFLVSKRFYFHDGTLIGFFIHMLRCANPKDQALEFN